MPSSAGSGAISLVTVLILIKMLSNITSSRRNKPIKAPTWAKELWSLIPSALLDSFTYNDWKGMQLMQSTRLKEFCDRALVAEFKRSHRIVLSLTTSPWRIRFLPVVLNLIDTEVVDEIALNLPRLFGRNQQEYEFVPRELEENAKVKIHWYDKDSGPIMKILNTVERERDPECICISIDDDIALPVNVLWSLVTGSIALGGRAVLGTKGATMRRFFSSQRAVQETEYFETLWPKEKDSVEPLEGTMTLDLVEGYGGIAYRQKHLDPKRLRDMSSCDKKCFMSDDIVLNMQMQQAGVQRFIVKGVSVNPFSFGNQDDALHIMQNHYEAYGRCVKFAQGK